MTQQLAQITQVPGRNVGLREEVGAQQECERLGVDGVGLHPRRGDRAGPQRMREVKVIAGVLQQFREPLPAVGRLNSDLALALQAAEQLDERLAAVDDPPRQHQLAVFVDHGDVRAVAM